MHILFIIDLFPPHLGGLEKVFGTLIEGLLKKNFKVTVITTRFSPELPEVENNGNLSIYRVGTTRRNFVWFALMKGLSIGKDVDVIHTTTFAGALPARILAQILKKKIIITVHEIFGMLRYRYKGRRKGFRANCYERLIINLQYNKVICVSHYTKNCLRVCYGVKDKTMQTIYNGLDTNLWQPSSINQKKSDEFKKEISEGKKVFCGMYYGHAGWSKGLDYLIQALPEILKKIPEFVLLMNLIPGKRNTEIIEMITKLGVQNNVIMTHELEVHDLINHIGAADVIIIPSLTEGFGFVAAESAALDKPCVLTDIGSLPEVASGKLIFVEASSLGKLADGVVQAYQSKYSETPRKNFDQENMIEEMVKVYEQTK